MLTRAALLEALSQYPGDKARSRGRGDHGGLVMEGKCLKDMLCRGSMMVNVLNPMLSVFFELNCWDPAVNKPPCLEGATAMMKHRRLMVMNG